MSFFSGKSLLGKVKSVWNALVFFILLILLFSPAPVLASGDFYGVSSNYNYMLNGYTSALKIEFDKILPSIQKLPTLSYEDGKKALTDLDTRLEQLKSDANNRATMFKKRSEQEQIEYEKNLNFINKNNKNLGGSQLNDLETKNQMQSGLVVINNYFYSFFNRLGQRINSAQKIDKKLINYTAQFTSFGDPNLSPEIESLGEALKQVIDFKFVDVNSFSGNSDQLTDIKYIFDNLGVYNRKNVRNFLEYGLFRDDPELLSGINELFQNLLVVKTEATNYTQTCKDIDIYGHILEANCKTSDQSFNRSSLSLQGIENIDGTLTVTSSWRTANFDESCEDVSISGNVISADCRTRGGWYEPTSIEIDGIVNIDGELEYASKP